MPQVYPTVEEARKLFVGLPPAHFERLLRVTLNFSPEPLRHLSCRAFLICAVADWLTTTTPIDEMQQRILFERLDSSFHKHTLALDLVLQSSQSLEGLKIPEFSFLFAKYQYVLWPGRQKYLDLQKAADIPKLPKPPIFTVVLDTAALVCFNLAGLTRLREQEQQQQEDQKRCQDALRTHEQKP
jgi:hypothetical protein